MDLKDFLSCDSLIKFTTSPLVGRKKNYNGEEFHWQFKKEFLGRANYKMSFYDAIFKQVSLIMRAQKALVIFDTISNRLKRIQHRNIGTWKIFTSLGLCFFVEFCMLPCMHYFLDFAYIYLLLVPNKGFGKSYTSFFQTVLQNLSFLTSAQILPNKLENC